MKRGLFGELIILAAILAVAIAGVYIINGMAEDLTPASTECGPIPEQIRAYEIANGIDGDSLNGEYVICSNWHCFRTTSGYEYEEVEI